ncbi:hypothetical protein [Streptomyces sp. NPDC006784]|uniref:hypothetical protein n=1 Tax=Streptomyces sp. NPDC006784 TaxID=3364764 RepID=UPI00368EA6B9
MSSELVKSQPATPATLPEKMQYAQALAQSGMLPSQYRQQPANLLYALEFADSLDLHPMAAITGVHVIEGKPSASSSLISALVRRAGHKLRVRGDDTKAVAQIIRSDDPDFVFECTWTMDRAQQAGLTGKQTWKKYPAAMLKARAITEVAREACEEALSGMHYTPEELGAQVDAEGNPMDAEVQQLRSVKPGEPDQWQQPAPQQGEPDRDYVAEARSAGEADAVRRIWQEAKAAGLDDVKLGHIAAVGKSLAAGPPPAKPTEPETDTDDAVDGEVVSEEEQAARTAEHELRDWAQANGLDDIAGDFEGATGMPLDQALAPQIRTFLNQLRGSAA